MPLRCSRVFALLGLLISRQLRLRPSWLECCNGAAFFWTPLSYPGQQQNRGDRVRISADCSSARVGHLAGSGAVAVDQFLDGDHRIACL